MNITELEALLFLLCALLGWGLYIKNGAVHVPAYRNIMLTQLIPRVGSGISCLMDTGDGNLTEVPYKKET
jgi:hypothetical protein